MMPLSFAEVYRMQAGCSEVKCFSVCSWAEGEGRKIWMRIKGQVGEAYELEGVDELIRR